MASPSVLSRWQFVRLFSAKDPQSIHFLHAIKILLFPLHHAIIMVVLLGLKIYIKWRYFARNFRKHILLRPPFFLCEPAKFQRKTLVRIFSSILFRPISGFLAVSLQQWIPLLLLIIPFVGGCHFYYVKGEPCAFCSFCQLLSFVTQDTQTPFMRKFKVIFFKLIFFARVVL